MSDHIAHLTIHGLLHLYGYDHIDDDDAIEMESIEIEILEDMGIKNPYTT
jgi:probable rRNA maturation factor